MVQGGGDSDVRVWRCPEECEEVCPGGDEC